MIAAILLSMLAAAGGDVISHWIFTPEHQHDGAVEDLAGAHDVQLSATSRVIGEAGGAGALLLTRAGDRALVHHSVARAKLPVEAFTVEAWVSVDRAQAWGGIVGVLQDNGGFEKGWLLGYRGDRFCLALSTEGADDGDGLMTYLSGESRLGLGRWFHVAGSYDGEVMRLYVDGRLEAESRAQSGAILYPRRAVYVIGAYLDDDEHYPMSGLIGEVKLWRRALAEEELVERHAALRAALSPQREPGAPVELGRWTAPIVEGAPGPPARRFAGDPTQPPPRVAVTPPGAAFTVEATLMVEDPRTAGAVATAGEPIGWVLGCGGGRFRFGVRPEGDAALTWAVANATFEPFRWYHVVGSYDGGLLRLFVDGEPAGFSRGASGSLGPLPDHLTLGLHEERTVRYPFTGRVHELRLLDRVLTENEVQARSVEKRSIFPEPIELAESPIARFRGGATASVHFLTETPARAAIELTAPGRSARTFESEAQGRRHVVTLTGLEPSCVHVYRVLGETEAGTRFATRSFPLDTAFDYEPPPLPEALPPPPDGDELARRYATAAEEILARCPVDRGWCLVLDAGEGHLALELARRSRFQIVAVEADARRRAAARRMLLEAGLYGERVSVHEDHPGELPYGDWFANLIVSDGALVGRRPTHTGEEVFRLQRPEGGVTILGAPRAARGRSWAGEDLDRWIAPSERGETLRYDTDVFHWVVRKRGELEGVGEWTHQYADPANTSSSGDEHLAGDLTVQWFGRPGPRPMLDRGARNPAPLYAGGRLYVQGDRRLFGIDAYNGTILWSLEIPDLRRANLPRDCSNTVADASSLYAAIEDGCWKIDGQTGERTGTFILPGATQGERAWGYLARTGDLLLGSETAASAPYRGAEGEWYDGLGAGEVQPVLSRRLFALDASTGEARWSYDAGHLLNSTITVEGNRIFFVEEGTPSGETARGGRLAAQTAESLQLVALELESGETVWERSFDFTALHRVMYLQARGELLLASGASEGYHAFAYDARSGEPRWEHHQPFHRDHHGGALQHPVLLADQVLIDRTVLELGSGKVLRSDVPSRRGCGTLSASADTIYFRDYSHGSWNPRTGERFDWLGLRSSCWLGMIPAGGLLLTPEGSSGCSCSDPIQTSAAFRPVAGGSGR